MMKLICLILLGFTTAALFTPKKDLEKDAVLTCNDDVFLNRSAGGEVLIKSDISGDSTSWSVSLTGEPVFLGKISFPGLYRVRINDVTNNILAYSCKDVAASRKSKIEYCYDSTADVDSVRKSMLATFDTLNRCVSKITLDTINMRLKELGNKMSGELDRGKYISFALSMTLDHPVGLLIYDPEKTSESDVMTAINSAFAEIFDLFTRNRKELILESSIDETLAFSNFFKPRPDCNVSGNKLNVFHVRPAVHIADELLAHYSKSSDQTQSSIWFGYRERHFNQLLLAGRIIGKK